MSTHVFLLEPSLYNITILLTCSLYSLYQQTYNNHWNWDDNNVIITAAAIDAVVAAGETSVFTFEFYPRVDGEENTVEFTLTV
jgi:hypothetical protein